MGLRLHLGCGDTRIEGFLNVDVRRTGATDAVWDLAEAMPLDDATVECAFSNAFFEHLYRDRRVEHLRDLNRLLQPGGFVCHLGMPYFKSIARLYLDRAPGIVGPVFDLYNVYRYTHGDPEHEMPDNYLAQLHKSLFDEDELRSLLLQSGLRTHLIFSYAFPGDAHELPVCIGFFARKIAPEDAGTLQRECENFLSLLDGRFIRLGSLSYL